MIFYLFFKIRRDTHQNKCDDYLRILINFLCILVFLFFLVRISSVNPAFEVGIFPSECNKLEGCGRVALLNSNRNDDLVPLIGMYNKQTIIDITLEWIQE